MRKHNAFTLIELMVAVGIIAVMASTVIVNVSRSRSRARDEKRKSDLLALQGALELYFATNRSYPSTAPLAGSGCVASGTLTFCGDMANLGSKGYSDPNAYVPGLAPVFIPILPSDPLTKNHSSPYAIAQNQPICGDNNWAGYFYVSDGKDYKVGAQCTIESPADPQFQDANPTRSSYSYAIATAGAKTW